MRKKIATDDCMDAGGRATQEAKAEDTEYRWFPRSSVGIHIGHNYVHSHAGAWEREIEQLLDIN